MLSDIIKGHTNEFLGLNEDISAKRMTICRKCPIYSPSFGGLCNDKLWIDPKTEKISFEPKQGYVAGCGCRLKAKTTLPNAHCVINKW